MKRLLAILTLCVWILVPAIAFFWFHHAMKAAKEEAKEVMRKGVPEADLVFLRFSTAKAKKVLDWEHEEEFEFQGQMYDVVHRNTTPDSLYLWCWADNKESKIKQQKQSLAKHFFGQKQERNNQNKLLQSFFKSLFNQSIQVLSSPWTTKRSSPLCDLSIQYVSPHLMVSALPPKSL